MEYVELDDEETNNESPQNNEERSSKKNSDDSKPKMLMTLSDKWINENTHTLVCYACDQGNILGTLSII
jgi:hypothetical protein